MFIHIDAFNFFNVISLSLVGRNKNVKKKKKKGGRGGGQKLALRFDCYHRAGENLTFFPKDRSLFLGSIVITEQVETSHFFLRTEACSSARLLSLSKWKPYIPS